MIFKAKYYCHPVWGHGAICKLLIESNMRTNSDVSVLEMFSSSHRVKLAAMPAGTLISSQLKTGSIQNNRETIWVHLKRRSGGQLMAL